MLIIIQTVIEKTILYKRINDKDIFIIAKVGAFNGTYIRYLSKEKQGGKK